MKWNIFGILRERRARKRKLREERDLLATAATLERLMTSGMISWAPKQRRMLISQPLAVLMMRSAESWQNFVQKLYQWTYLKQCNQAWEKYFQKEELAAVRVAVAAAEPHHALGREDIERIKRARRQEIAFTEMAPPKVEPFEFFVLPDSTEAAPKPVFVGRFDPESGEQQLALWSDVETFLKN